MGRRGVSGFLFDVQMMVLDLFSMDRSKVDSFRREIVKYI